MTRARRIAFSVGILMISCPSTFGQFVTNPVEKILTDASIPNAKKSDRLAALGQEGVPKLLEYLKENTRAWNFIVPALGAIGDPRATDHLLGRLDAEPNELRIVIRALAGLKDPKAVEPLLKLMDSVSRGEAISALAAIGDVRAEAPILEILNSKDQLLGARVGAAVALSKFASDPAKTQATAFLLNDAQMEQLLVDDWKETKDSPARNRTTWWDGLRAIGTEEAQRILVRGLDKPLMDYDHGTLMEIMSGISNPSVELIESLYRYSGKNFPSGAYYSALALETLAGYGPIVEKDRLLGEIRRWLERVEAKSDSSPSSHKIILRLTRLKAEVDSWK